ncbi:hypothetical protein HHK36_031577 [Tetracentron sinense]|uniref:Uncharacterized protein n=1 Tax=Tetracentron sinense TaxID=13715 RepID=A0A834Y9E3_TETSI|nr:hypothetical protein HHK36_031577 [Tetracentron sinense]
MIMTNLSSHSFAESICYGQSRERSGYVDCGLADLLGTACHAIAFFCAAAVLGCRPWTESFLLVFLCTESFPLRFALNHLIEFAWPLSDGQLQLVQRAGLLPLLKWHSFSLDAPLLTAIVRKVAEVHWEPYKNAMLDDVPDELQQILLDSETAQGNARGYVDWRRMYQKEIKDWDRWQTEREWFDGPPATHELSVSGDYMDWYERITWMRIQSCTEWTGNWGSDRNFNIFNRNPNPNVVLLECYAPSSVGVMMSVFEEALGDLQNLANMDIDALDVDNEESELFEVSRHLQYTCFM